MSQPTPYTRGYSFSNWSATHPNKPQPGVSLDTEFEAVELTLGQVRTNLAMIQRDDGALANGAVGPDQLSSEITIGLRSVSEWVTGGTYIATDAVWYGSNLYRCLLSHTGSAAFATDLAAGRWTLVVDMAPYAQTAAEAAVTAEVLAGIDLDLDLGPINTALALKAGLADNNAFTGANSFSQAVSLLGGFSAGIGPATSSADYWTAQPTDYASGKPRVVLRKSTTAALWELKLEDSGGVAGTLNIIAGAVQINGSTPWTETNFDPDTKADVADLPVDVPSLVDVRRISTRRTLIF